ncbi:hypothetical protein [Brevundimonas sp.]|uniref:hypothetical protein n=1 Tax=Brevundimonas sp. TaxID=1871086 RepID=UPI0035B00087
MERLKTDPLAVAGALMTGGLAGGVMYSLQAPVIALFKATPETVTAEGVIGAFTLVPLFLSIFAVPGFLLGMLTIGWPIWFVLHLLGARSPWIGALAGSGAAGFAGQLLSSPGSFLSIISLPLLVFPGAVAGWVAWRLIYPAALKRPPAPPV